MKLIFSILLLPMISNATIRVAIIDTGLDRTKVSAPLCKDSNPFPDGPRYEYHGTNVADAIIKNAENSDYCLIPISVFTPTFNYDMYVKALELLTKMHIDVLNLSFAGRLEYAPETKYIKKLLDQGVIVFAAAGNDGDKLTEEICTVYPACIDKRITVVGTYDGFSGKGSRVGIVSKRNKNCVRDKCLVGTSQATAIETGRFLRFLERHK